MFPARATEWSLAAKWACKLDFSTQRSSPAFSSSLVPIKHYVTSGKQSVYVGYYYWGYLVVITSLDPQHFFETRQKAKKGPLIFPVLVCTSLCRITLSSLWTIPGAYLFTPGSWAWPRDLLWLMGAGECAQNGSLNSVCELGCAHLAAGNPRLPSSKCYLVYG